MMTETDPEYSPTVPEETDASKPAVTTANDLPQLGEKLLGRYEVFGRREGGQGIVFFLRDLVEQRSLAAKTWKGLTTENGVVQDFRNEAEFWIGLTVHPNILQAFSVEIHRDRPYLLMEYVEGGNTLRDLLRHHIPRSTALSLAHQFCLGMEAASSKGEVAHLDLKPENLLITLENVLKVTDFGLSSSVNVYQGKVPRPRHGSWPYAAPERYLSQPEDSRSDIYAFGIILYEMLTGRLPFPKGLDHRSTRYAYENFYVSGEMKDISREIYSHGIPGMNEAPMNMILDGCLISNPADRFPNFKSLRKQLEASYKLETPEYLQKAIETERDVYTQAMSYYRLGQYGMANELLNAALIKRPDDALLWYAAGRVLVAEGLVQEGRAAFQQALRINPGLEEARELLNSLSK
jgi:serine/threonine protein kinase